MPGQIPHFLRVGDAVSDAVADHQSISNAQDPTRGRRSARPVRKTEWSRHKATHVPNSRGRIFFGRVPPKDRLEVIAALQFGAGNDAAGGTKEKPSRCPGIARHNRMVIRVVGDLPGRVEDLPRRPGQEAWR
jgi:hypothetical protein